jgi:hypothetical protein
MVAEGVFSTGEIGSYCTVDDVLALLASYDLSGLGDSEQIAARVNGALPAAMEAVEALADRDFDYHQAAVVRVNGSGTDTLSLAESGAVPIIDIAAVTVNGRNLDSSRLVVGSDEASLRMLPRGRAREVFARGKLNVEVVLDWGFTAPPSDICTAQAKLAAAEILASMAGLEGTAESVRIGDYEARYGAGGALGAAILALTESARRIAGRYWRMSVGAV